jgi:hypothetical protein
LGARGAIRPDSFFFAFFLATLKSGGGSAVGEAGALSGLDRGVYEETSTRRRGGVVGMAGGKEESKEALGVVSTVAGGIVAAELNGGWFGSKTNQTNPVRRPLEHS